MPATSPRIALVTPASQSDHAPPADHGSMPPGVDRIAEPDSAAKFDADVDPIADDDATARTGPASPRVRAAFGAQATDEMRRYALRFARQRAIMARRLGARVDHLVYARELVQDALTDTWMGVVAWEPDEAPLALHVRSLIRTRSWKRAADAIEAPHDSIDGPDRAVSRKADEALYHATQGSVTPIVLAAVTSRVVRELRRLAKGDPTTTAILDAWAAKRIDRDEVIAHTGLTERAYKAARARLTYLVLDLPQSMRAEVQATLRSNS